MKTLKIQNQNVNVNIDVITGNDFDFISLTDIAKFKNQDDPSGVIANWLRNRDTIEFLGLWENLYNSNFKPLEFEGFKNSAGSNAFTLSPSKWIHSVGAIGLQVKSGRYKGGTFAHKDIAFEFASWISAEIKLYIIKEFQRLKKEENEKNNLGWSVKRELTKINYRYHTDAVKNHLILPNLSKKEIEYIYSDEADLLNKVLFGETAREWRNENSDKPKSENIRDYADYYQLIILSNIETLNAEYLKMNKPQSERIILLREAVTNMFKTLEKTDTSMKKIIGSDKDLI